MDYSRPLRDRPLPKVRQANPNATKVSKTVGWMNKHSSLQMPISFHEVAEPLESIGEEKAGKLLAELSEKSHAIKDPNGWLKKAIERINGTTETVEEIQERRIAKREAQSENVKSYGKGKGKGEAPDCKWCAGGECWTHNMTGGKGGFDKGKGKGKGKNPFMQMMEMFMGGPQPSQKVSKTIGWMNKNLALAQAIKYHEVSEALTNLGEFDACKLLSELSTMASPETIKNPTAWLLSAASRRQQTDQSWW